MTSYVVMPSNSVKWKIIQTKFKSFVGSFIVLSKVNKMFELKQSTSDMIIMLPVPSLSDVNPLHGLKAFKLKLDPVQGHIFQILYVQC